jgi:hypothetical protein
VPGANAGGRPGRGGVSRGRGDAALGHTGDTKAAEGPFRPERLPPGVPIPEGALRIGVGRAAPQANPVREAGPGAAGATGVGEAAWRRRLAPSVRSVVRDYFGPAAAPGATGDAAGK